MGVQCDKASLQSRRHKTDPWMALCVSSHALLVALHPALQWVTLTVYEAANGAQVNHFLSIGVVCAFNSSFGRATHLTPLHECNIHTTQTSQTPTCKGKSQTIPLANQPSPMPPHRPPASQPASQPVSPPGEPANQRSRAEQAAERQLMQGGNPRRRASARPIQPAKRRSAGPPAEARAPLAFFTQVRAICENKTWKEFCVFPDSLGDLTLEMVLGKLGRTDLTLRCGGLCVPTRKGCDGSREGTPSYVQFYDVAGFARALAHVERSGFECKCVTLSFDAPSPAVPPPDGDGDSETTDEDDPALFAEFYEQERKERQRWLQRQRQLKQVWPYPPTRSEASGAGGSPVHGPALPAVRFFDGDEVMGEGEGVLSTAGGGAPQVNSEETEQRVAGNGGGWVLINGPKTA